MFRSELEISTCQKAGANLIGFAGPVGRDQEADGCAFFIVSPQGFWRALRVARNQDTDLGKEKKKKFEISNHNQFRVCGYSMARNQGFQWTKREEFF